MDFVVDFGLRLPMFWLWCLPSCDLGEVSFGRVGDFMVWMLFWCLRFAGFGICVLCLMYFGCFVSLVWFGGGGGLPVLGCFDLMRFAII